MSRGKFLKISINIKNILNKKHKSTYQFLKKGLKEGQKTRHPPSPQPSVQKSCLDYKNKIDKTGLYFCFKLNHSTNQSITEYFWRKSEKKTSDIASIFGNSCRCFNDVFMRKSIKTRF